MGGGCACGKVRYVADISSAEAYLCHCRMCQRATGSISIAFKNVRKDAVRWQSPADHFESSPIARRGHCAACGTSLTFEYPDSENIDLTVASFDEPDWFVPVHHFGAESLHRAWLNTEGLPEIRTEQHEPLVERWIKTVGKLPD